MKPLLPFLILLFAAPACGAQVQTTALDTTFADRGILLTDSASTKLRSSKLALLPDGRMLLAGTHFYYLPNFDIVSELRLLRFLPDGRPDSSLNGTGILSKPTPRLNTLASVIIQPDQKILVTGTKGLIERFLPDGSPDYSFNDSAHITIGFFGPYDYLAGTALQPDGGILTVGYVAQQYLLLMRFLPNGQVDNSFGFNGMVTGMIDSTHNLTGTAIALQPDGKILVAGNARGDTATRIAVIRYLSDGSIDPAFHNGTGYRRVSFPGARYTFANSLQLLPDGRIFLSAGTYANSSNAIRIHPGFIRLDGNGSDDLTLNGSGRLLLLDTLDNYTPFYESTSSSVLADGSWLLANTEKSLPGNRRFLLRKFRPDGTPDPAFGNSGFIATDITAVHDIPSDVAIQNDGKILVCGTTDINDAWPQSTRYTPAIVRYRPDAKLVVPPPPKVLRSFAVLPNPATAAVQLKVVLGAACHVRVALQDVAGRSLVQQEYEGAAGNNEWNLHLGAHVPAGIYLLSVETQGERQAVRLKKQ